MRVELYTDFTSVNRYIDGGKCINVGFFFITRVSDYRWICDEYDRFSTDSANFTQAVQEFNPAKPTHRLEFPQTGDEINQLSQVFNILLDRMYHLMQQQNHFVSDASHELRTPIAVIRGYLDLLRRWGLSNPEVTQEALTTMDQELRRIENMTERLLRLARFGIEEPREQEIFSIGELVEERVRRWRQVIKEIEIDYTLPEQVFKLSGLKADWEELLDILLDNAGKYTDKDGKIHIQAEMVGGRLHIAVQDTGQGIPAADLPHVFKRFYRVKRTRTVIQSGSGLGLAIAQEIVQKYQGKLKIHSQLGKGTTVTVIVPFSN